MTTLMAWSNVQALRAATTDRSPRAVQGGEAIGGPTMPVPGSLLEAIQGKKIDSIRLEKDPSGGGPSTRIDYALSDADVDSISVVLDEWEARPSWTILVTRTGAPNLMIPPHFVKKIRLVDE